MTVPDLTVKVRLVGSGLDYGNCLLVVEGWGVVRKWLMTGHIV